MGPIGCLPNRCEILSTLDPIALFDQEPPIEAIRAQIVFIVLDNNKVTVALESTATINNRPGPRGLDHLAGRAADSDTLPRPVTLTVGLGQLAGQWPTPLDTGTRCPAYFLGCAFIRRRTAGLGGRARRLGLPRRLACSGTSR